MSKSESALLHIYSLPHKLNTLQTQQHALMQSTLAWKPDVPVMTEHSLPGQASIVCVTQGPGYLSSRAGMSRSSRDVAVGRDLAARNAPHDAADIIVIPHLFPEC
jgi:hypothetical protein